MSENTTPEKVMTNSQLADHYRAAIEYLDKNHAYFLTHVLKIGRPKWTAMIATAAVMMQQAEDSDEEYEFDFIFNPKFASTLPVDVMAFILAHEAFHIILNHLKLAGQFVDKDKRNTLVKKLEKREKLTRDEYVDWIKIKQAEAKFNIAADCVINDYLVSNGFTGLEGGMYGLDKIGQDATYLTVAEVFDALPEQKSQDKCDSCGGTGQKQDQDDEGEKGDDEGKGQDGQDGDEGESDAEGEDAKGGKGKAHGEDGKGEPCPDCQGSGKGQPGDPGDGRGAGAFDSHDWMFDPDFADKMADAIEKIQEEVDEAGKLPQDVVDKMAEEAGEQTEAQKKLQQSMRAGSEEGNQREFVEQHGLSMAWIKLLKEVDPMMFKEPGMAPPPRPEWHRKPRKLGNVKKVTLPVYGTARNQEKISKEKKSIVLALDYSGSIGPHDADRFATLAKSIPQDRIKVFACTFTTSYRKHDLENPLGGGGGGTDFNAIQSFIEDEVQPALKGEYPTAVVVITDGEASFSNAPKDEKHRAAYRWLLSPDRAGNHYPASKTIGQWAMLEDYIAS